MDKGIYSKELENIFANHIKSNNNIMICEINDKYLAIPYVDIAADYNVHMITIDKNSEIKIWNDENMQRLTRIDPTKEKGED